jgi:hypothetical protein
VHDILSSLGKNNMPDSDAFAFRRSGLSEFLFAPVGTEANGMTLSLVSVFARLGDDPWREAGRLARLPKSAAVESLAQTIAAMPASLWPIPSATAIATRLIALLPRQPAKLGHGLPASAASPKTWRFLAIRLALVGLVFALACQIGVLMTTHASKPGGSEITSAAALPR